MYLDPPRSATPPGMIRELARMLEPRRVVEIFCGPDEIGRSLREWRSAGYEPERITPIDLFPGTMGLEVVISLAAVEEPEREFRRDVPAPRRTPRGTGGPRRR